MSLIDSRIYAHPIRCKTKDLITNDARIESILFPPIYVFFLNIPAFIT